MIQIYAIGGLLVAVIATGAWASVERSGRKAEAGKRVEAERVAVANERAVAAVIADRERTVSALTGLAEDLARREIQSTSVRRAIDAAETTATCLDSPAVRSMLDGLRGADGGASRTPPGAGDPVDLSPGTRGGGVVDGR